LPNLAHHIVGRPFISTRALAACFHLPASPFFCFSDWLSSGLKQVSTPLSTRSSSVSLFSGTVDDLSLAGSDQWNDSELPPPGWAFPKHFCTTASRPGKTQPSPQVRLNCPPPPITTIFLLVAVRPFPGSPEKTGFVTLTSPDQSLMYHVIGTFFHFSPQPMDPLFCTSISPVCYFWQE